MMKVYELSVHDGVHHDELLEICSSVEEARTFLRGYLKSRSQPSRYYSLYCWDLVTRKVERVPLDAECDAA